MALSPEEKKLEKLNALFELVNQDFATPDDLIQMSEAILGIITKEKDRVDKLSEDSKGKAKKELDKTITLLENKEQSLKNIINQLANATDREIAKVDTRLSKELERVERRIPSKTDLSGLESDLKALKGQLNTLPTEITLNNEAIRDGLELLQGDERLDKSAIKGLDDWEEIATLARSPKTITGAGVKLLRYLQDVNIDGITNGQTILWNSSLQRFEAGTGGTGGGHTIQDEGTPLTQRTKLNFVGTGVTVTDGGAGPDSTIVTITSGGGAGVTDGDKGDITVTASGATWTVDNAAITLAKQADMATGSLVYRKTALAGAPEIQTLATLKTDLGLTGTNTGDQTTIVGITGTKAQFDTAVSDGNIQYVGDAPTAHTHLLAAGATDVTVTAANLNILDDGLNTTLHFHDADRARANHTGSQLASTISDFAATVRATVLTGLSLVSVTVIAATDTVLVALGSLQAQITALTTTVSSKANAATTISTTAPLSGGGDLSANRTLTTSMNTNKLIGRGTAAVGVMEEITLGTGLSLTGTTLNAAGGSTINYNYFYIDQAGGTSDTYGVLAGTRNGSNAVFTVAQSIYATGTLKVWKNGQLLTQGSSEDWTETSPATGTFTFIVAPAATDEITVTYQKAVAGAVTTPYGEVPTGAVNSANTTYTLANTPAAAMGVIVVLDGIVQYYTEDYTVSGSTITFVTAPTTGTTIFVYYNASTATSQTSLITSYRAVTATTTFLAGDYTINCTSGTYTVNLPTAVGRAGQIYVTKNSGAGTITLDGSGAETIDGAATQTVSAGTALTVQSTNVGWIII